MIELHVTEPSPVALMVHTGKSKPELQSKTVTPTETQQAITADDGYDGLNRVDVNPIPSQYIVPSEALDITENGNGIDVTSKASVNVNVPIPPEYIVPTGDKNITENGTYDISQYATATVNVGGGEWVSPTGRTTFLYKRVTLDEDFNGTVAAFLQKLATLVNVTNFLCVGASLVELGGIEDIYEVGDVIVGYLATAYRSRFWRFTASGWRPFDGSNPNVNTVAQKNSVYEVVGFVLSNSIL